MQTNILAALVTAGLLGGCASTPAVPSRAPSVPYWQNPQWINELATTITNGLVYPAEATKVGFPSGQAIVQFSYDNGRLRDVRIVKSTGSQILDSALAVQIANMRPPLARGLNTNTSRRFQLPVNLSVKDSGFFRSMRNAIQTHVHYPRTAVLHGEQGFIVVRFEYRNGNVLNPTVVKSIGSKVFEHAALKQLSHAKMPPPPVWARDKTFTFQVPFCFVFSEGACPGTHMEIRYMSSNTQLYPTASLCTQVVFDYKGNKISDVRVADSSGDAKLDKAALLTISQGNFPQPSATLKNQAASFKIPVCFSNKISGQPTAKTQP